MNDYLCKEGTFRFNVKETLCETAALECGCGGRGYGSAGRGLAQHAHSPKFKSPVQYKPEVGGCGCYFTQKVGAGGPEPQGHPQLPGKFETNLEHTQELIHKTSNNKLRMGVKETHKKVPIALLIDLCAAAQIMCQCDD